MPMLDTLGTTAIPKGIKIIKWPVYAIAPQTTPLQTNGMCYCCAFRINGTHDRHYLLHLVQNTAVTNIQKHLLEDVPWALDDENTAFDLVPGVDPQTIMSVTALLKALHRIKPALVEKVRFRHFPDESAALGRVVKLHNPRTVVSYQGELFCHPAQSPTPQFLPGGHSIRKSIKPITY